MLYLRRLFFSKLGQLARERKDMIGKLPTDPMVMPGMHAGCRFCSQGVLVWHMSSNQDPVKSARAEFGSLFKAGLGEL